MKSRRYTVLHALLLALALLFAQQALLTHAIGHAEHPQLEQTAHEKTQESAHHNGEPAHLADCPECLLLAGFSLALATCFLLRLRHARHPEQPPLPAWRQPTLPFGRPFARAPPAHT